MVSVKLAGETCEIVTLAPYPNHLIMTTDRGENCRAFTNRRDLDLHMLMSFRESFCKGDAECLERFSAQAELMESKEMNQGVLAKWRKIVRDNAELSSAAMRLESNHPVLSRFRWALRD